MWLFSMELGYNWREEIAIYAVRVTWASIETDYAVLMKYAAENALFKRYELRTSFYSKFSPHGSSEMLGEQWVSLWTEETSVVKKWHVVFVFFERGLKCFYFIFWRIVHLVKFSLLSRWSWYLKWFWNVMIKFWRLTSNI